MLRENDRQQFNPNLPVFQHGDFNDKPFSDKTLTFSARRIPKDRTRFLRFACVGVIDFMVDALCFAGLINIAHLPICVARIIAFLPADMCTWYLHQNLTFGDRIKSPKKRQEYASYVIIYMLGTSVNFLVFMAVMLALSWAKHYWLIPLLAGTASGLVFNYFLLNLRIFKPSPARQLAVISHRGHQL